ncbi:MAG: molybdopterin-dependent oxidoreductase [Candidatus Diapherotrites archaeon]|nr:molybdopterin-dependent oxidoreductase [Candidatus Diapherotrites archaeon]
MNKLFLLFLVLFLFGCVNSNQNSVELPSVEVREYQGENLSSINDFRENSIKGPQVIDADSYYLEVSGLVESPKNYSYEEVLQKQNYSKVITLHCVEGWSAKILWEGVLLKDLFDEVKVKPEASTVIFYAFDGYSTSLPLDYILNNDILIAFKMNEVILPAERGFPFQLVAEDKWGYKWIKWITKIELSDNPQFKGFWEQRGYNNNGDLSGSKFE